MALWLSLNFGLLLIAYLLGSFPSGYLAGRLLKNIDIRSVGSGSTGATNVLRTLGKGPAIAVLLADMLKGVLAIVLVRVVLGMALVAPTSGTVADWLPWLETVAGLMALLGHSKSIWLNFTGGKSVATGLGLLLALNWQVGLSALGVFAGMLALFRIVSLGSITAALAVAILMVLFQQPIPYQLFAIAGGLYVILRHKSNIQRLLAGTEPRIGQPVPQTAEPTLDNREQVNS